MNKKTLDYKFKTVPFKHQLDAWNRTNNHKYFAFLMEMGTGKSKLLIDTAAFMYDQGWINAMIIFGLKGMYTNWIDQIKEHIPDHIEYEIGLWSANANVTEMNKILHLFYTNKLTFKILIMNIESLAFKRSRNLALKFTSAHNTLAVVDESTTIKNPKAARTKAAWDIGKIAKARRILTGSAVDNRPLDIWAQFQFLSNGCLGHTSFYSFKAEYAILEEMKVKNNGVFRQFKTIVGYKNLDNLKKAIEKYSFIVKKKDCLDLPPKIYQKCFVELTEEQKYHYDRLKKESFTQLSETSLVTTKIVLTKLLRLHQLVCGHLSDDDKNIHSIPHNRLFSLSSLLEEIEGKVIIWANYRASIEEIEVHLKKEYGNDRVLSYYGDTPQAMRDTARVAFKRGKDSIVKFLIGNPQTAGYGLDLTAATTVIYYSNSFDAEKRNQSEDRAHRIGQTESVTYIDMIAQGTIDEKILQALKAKKNLSDLITTSNWASFF